MLMSEGCMYSELYRGESSGHRQLNTALDMLFLTRPITLGVELRSRAASVMVLPPTEVTVSAAKAMDKRLTGMFNSALHHFVQGNHNHGWRGQLRNITSQEDLQTLMQSIDVCYGFKEPHVSLYLPYMQALYPLGATFVHVLRDPRDLALTYHPYGLLTVYDTQVRIAFGRTVARLFCH